MDTKILDKIRKLLAKANDSGVSQEEMETFLAAAQRLQLKYNIESEALELDVTDFGHEMIDSTKQKRESRGFEGKLLQTIANANNCKILWNSYGKTIMGYQLIGSHDNRVVVKEMFKVCIERFRSYAQPRYKQFCKVQQAEAILKTGNKYTVKELRNLGVVSSARIFLISYLDGAVQGLSARFDRETEEELIKPEAKEKWGLIVVKHDDLIEEYKKKAFGRLGRINLNGRAQRFNAAAEMGYNDGNTKSMRKELN